MKIQTYKTRKFTKKFMDIFLEILNGCISFIIGPSSTKREGFVKLGKIYPTISTLSSLC